MVGIFDAKTRNDAPFRRSNSKLVGASFFVKRSTVRNTNAFGDLRLSVRRKQAARLRSSMLGRSQVVRHRSLESAFVGSILPPQPI